MPRYNVEYKGKWACFSSIPDGFITSFMDKGEYEEWRMEEYGIDQHLPAEKCNRKTMPEAVFSASVNRTYGETVECLLETGLAKDEIVSLVDMHGYN